MHRALLGSRALASLALALALGPWGCQDKLKLAPTPLAVRHESPRLRPADDALEIPISVSNPTASPQEIFLFVTAHNNEPRPPTRVIWPPAAEPELRNSFAGLIVGRPERGYRIALAPGAETATVGVLLPDLERRVLKEYWVQAVDASGQLVFDSRGPLR